MASAITDFLDGYIARNYNQASQFGAFLDPVADKVNDEHMISADYHYYNECAMTS